MARSILATEAMTDYCQLSDDQGRLVLLPKAVVTALRRAGMASVNLTVSLNDEAPRKWLTLSEATRAHLDDVDGITPNSAKVKIYRACKKGEFISEGAGSDRRIEPNSFEAWRLKEREVDLDRCDGN